MSKTHSLFSKVGPRRTFRARSYHRKEVTAAEIDHVGRAVERLSLTTHALRTRSGSVRGQPSLDLGRRASGASTTDDRFLRRD